MSRTVAFAVVLAAALIAPARVPAGPSGPPPSDASPTAAAAPAGTLTIKQIAVRQGDGALVQGPCGELGLIDNNRFREAEVLEVLDGFGSRALEFVAVSHYDADHLGGILGVATAPGASVARAIDRGGDRGEKDSQTYRAYFDWATSDATTREPVDIGDSFSLCTGQERVTFEVVSAGTDGNAAGGVAVREENDKGVCLKVTYHLFDWATCGDVNGTDEGSRSDVESAVAPAIGEVDFAKINHHGSPFSSNETYVGTLSASAAVVSTGANGFGHPDPAVLARWAEHGDVFQTQDTDNNPVDGTVTVMTTGETYFTVTTSASRLTRSYSLDPSLRCPGRKDEPGNHLVGTAGPDLIGATNGADVICGLKGRDKLLGGPGPDLLFGGGGHDRLFGNAGHDLLIGGRGTDRCRGGRGSNTLRNCER